MPIKYSSILKISFLGSRCKSRYKSDYSHLYTQGQYAAKRIREYFYFIDHQGQLFLDDVKVKNFITCFKDEAFLQFFFKRVKKNQTGQYESSFPYLSLCGRERNYLRCDDTPIVYTHLKDVSNSGNGEHFLSVCGAGDKFLVPFRPKSLCMLPHTGRVYHEAEERFGGIGLIKSSLAIELSTGFRFDDQNGVANTDLEASFPTRFLWKDNEYALTNEIVSKLVHNDS